MGNVMSIMHGMQKILKPDVNSNGYYRVCLRPIKKWYFVHRLVAEAFVPKKDGCNIINHKDENRKNNKAENLEWCTQSYNILYSNVGVRNNKTRRCKIIATDVETGFTIEFESIRDSERKGFYRKSVQKCLNNPNYTHKGMKWEKVQL